MSDASDPHGGKPVIRAGAPTSEAAAALIMLHGRGSSAEDMLRLFTTLDVDDVAALAPQAANSTWYPQSFLAPLERNQPYLDSALNAVAAIVDELLQSEVPAERIALLGFSQGACLTCEFVARNPRSYGAVMALTGGLIGPPGSLPQYGGSLAGVPVFLGTSHPDAHVPVERVEETAEVFRSMGASVDLRKYLGMPHTINDEELGVCRALLQSLTQDRRLKDER
jgi:phospholipase/carboxylesterase